MTCLICDLKMLCQLGSNSLGKRFKPKISNNFLRNIMIPFQIFKSLASALPNIFININEQTSPVLNDEPCMIMQGDQLDLLQHEIFIYNAWRLQG